MLGKCLNRLNVPILAPISHQSTNVPSLRFTEFFLVVYFAVPFVVREERAPLNPKSVISVETILVVGVKVKGFELKQKMQNIYS